MFSARELLKQRLDGLNNKISERLDFDFSAVSRNIDTIDDFNREIFSNFEAGGRIFYRGERINSRERNLLPTLLRNQDNLFGENDLGIAHIDADYIFNYYGSMGDFVRVFNNTMGRADSAHLYEICAFAQHYFRVSPLIDFSKSLYSALSFALKGREVFASDIVLYTVELKDGEDYTNNIAVADRWLSDIDICVSRFEEADVKGAVREIIGNKGVNMTDEFKRHLEHINTSPVPKAKLIDVPTNTRMKFQQGVFLMLTDFQLFNIKYFTKNNG